VADDRARRCPAGRFAPESASEATVRRGDGECHQDNDSDGDGDGRRGERNEQPVRSTRTELADDEQPSVHIAADGRLR